MTRRALTIADRVAIGELLRLATQVCAVSKKRAVFALGALVAERAANIYRGEEKPFVASRADLREFAKVWDVGTRAKFNPAKRPMAR